MRSMLLERGHGKAPLRNSRALSKMATCDRPALTSKDDLNPVNEHVVEERQLGMAALKLDFVQRKRPHGEIAGDVPKANSEELDSKKTKKSRGQNKHRPRAQREPMSSQLCKSARLGEVCTFDGCRYLHDVQKFLESKPPNIGPECVFFSNYGNCPYGVTCRFGEKHICPEEHKSIVRDGHSSHEATVVNVLSKQLQEDLRKKKVEFPRSSLCIAELNKKKKKKSVATDNASSTEKKADEIVAANDDKLEMCGSLTDEDLVKLRPEEKRVINFRGKLYLAPLTTVGNLPFRRVCKEYGADITCGEMALCVKLLQGQQSEWALVKRHESEDLFGAQICGGFSDTMTKCAELLCNQTSVDFIDINCGCPIDMIYTSGAGSALMRRLPRLQEIVLGMKSVMTVPLTLKMRTGVYDKSWNAHTLAPKLRDWGVDLLTIHGRSREQRYTKTADYDYIGQCAQAVRPMPVFGNGDVLSFVDYEENLEKSRVDGLMMGRGALIKPWIFTEIKERRHWDISSHERLEIVRNYVNYGLEHWGSDTQGVERTRRFLLEWLSFLHRYIPVGLLERVPHRINERAPAYVGRDDMETLMASANCSDWIKISEMFLGPVDGAFTFLPKHKANSYS